MANITHTSTGATNTPRLLSVAGNTIVAPDYTNLYYYFDIDNGITVNESNEITSWDNKIIGNASLNPADTKPLLDTSEVVAGNPAVKLIHGGWTNYVYYKSTYTMSDEMHFVCVVCKALSSDTGWKQILISGRSYSYVAGTAPTSGLRLNAETNQFCIPYINTTGGYGTPVAYIGEMPSGTVVTDYNVYIFKLYSNNDNTGSIIAYVNGVKMIDSGTIAIKYTRAGNDYGVLGFPTYIGINNQISNGHVLAMLRWKASYDPGDSDIIGATDYFKQKFGLT